MPVCLVSENAAFPPFTAASGEGLLAIGGHLSRKRLLEAYSKGIFPWYSEDTPILWWTPPERCMLRPDELHIPRSLRRAINSRRFVITLDHAFPRVMRACAESLRPDQDGTWIVPEMIAAYTDLHNAGYAHSVEAWRDGNLVGGLYGVSLGKGFFGESMFFHEPDASKICFVWLARLLTQWKFSLIDCQQVTDNLSRFGAYSVTRDTFMTHLRDALSIQAPPGKWTMPEDFFPL